MVLDKIIKFGKAKEGENMEEKEPESDWVELDSSAFKENVDINVGVENLKSFSDTDRIQTMVRDGKIVFLRIRDLRQKDISELKRAVDKLKKTCSAIDGDIIGIDEDFLVMTPSFARIWRG
jgi:SepF-like predicted cell division protein (DUF552 family)